MNPGIYLHIPFCNSKCGYCDFYSITDQSDLTNFLKQLQNEIKLYAAAFQPVQSFDSIYIGGGTPSILSPDQISSLLELIYKLFPIANDVEITLEVNPGTVDHKKLQDFKSTGFNRLSIGIQSFDDRELKILGRIHSANDSKNCFIMARCAGFDNINMDLIYALPEQILQNWENNLKKTVQLNPEHISTYNLTIDKGTLFYKLAKSGYFKPQSETNEEQFFNTTHNILNEAGYLHYEVSNFAKSEKYVSRHNYKHWKHIPYLGFGPSAHSFWNNQRWANVLSVKKYITQLSEKKKPLQFKEKLATKDLLFEHIFLNLRTYSGINLQNFKKDFSLNFVNKFEKIVEPLLKLNYAILDDNYFKLTHKGMILCDEILPSFVES